MCLDCGMDVDRDAAGFTSYLTQVSPRRWTTLQKAYLLRVLYISQVNVAANSS